LAEDPRPIGDALARVRRELGTPDPGRLEEIRAAWRGIVGDALADHSRPLYVRDGVLRIVVEDPAWAGQFRYLNDTLVATLAQRFPKVAITEISVGRAPGE
jgi:predicted nucleic acid-binding Zn ribbon protein